MGGDKVQSGEVIHEEARDVPVIADVDVCVVGGGSAGVPAALAAARQGARTLLVERFNYLGGAATGGLTITLPACPYTGIMGEILQELHRDGFYSPELYVFSPEMYKLVCLRLLDQAGVQMLFYSPAVSSVVQDGRLAGVIVEGKSGRQAIRARLFVDCSGDGDICAWAGVPFDKRPLSEMLPVTLMCLCMGATDEGLARLSKIPIPEDNPSDKSRDDYHRSRPAQHTRGGVGTRVFPGELNIWGGHLAGIDGTDALDLSRSEVELREQVLEWYLWARKTVPGLENLCLTQTATQMGVRETRRIRCEHRLLTREWESNQQFPDNIAISCADRQIPYRSLVPLEIEDVLVAGRCHDTDKLQTRTVSDCAMMGQAAGTAAALAANQGVTPRQLNVGLLQQALRDSGDDIDGGYRTT